MKISGLLRFFLLLFLTIGLLRFLAGMPQRGD